MRIVTETLPEGEVRVSQYSAGIIADVVYLWQATGWKRWIESETVEAGGYWRTVSDEDQLLQLNIQMQRAISALVIRNPDKAVQENTDE